MPFSSKAASSPQGGLEPFHSPYRTEGSFKNFSTFLNRKLILNSCFPNQAAKFSLLDILKQLDVTQAYLKGSAVHSWKLDTAPSDIDFQFHCDPAASGEQIVEKLLDFLDAASDKPFHGKPELREKHWFNKVTRDFGGAWNRMVLSMGYPGPKATTLDLNFTNRPQISYDTIHASKAIFVDWESRKMAVVDSWHPALVEWIQQARLLWFNPDMEEGLRRLSYRLSKSADMQLLQPAIADDFFQQASMASVGNVYLRVLLGEYSNSSLTSAEQATLWKTVLNVASTGTSRQHQGLHMDMLAWSKYNQAEQLNQALEQADMQETAVQRLKQGALVGADFKTALRNLLQTEEAFRLTIAPLVSKALGATLVSPERLFERLDSWDHIQNIPEHELQTVLSDWLNHWEIHGEQAIKDRCANMMGWLQGDELSSVKFWVNRIPSRSLSSPSDKSCGPVVQATLQLIKTQGVPGFASALPVLEDLRLKREHWTIFINVLLDEKPSAFPPSTQPRSICMEFLELLNRHADILSDKPNPATQAAVFLADWLALSNRARTEKIPNLIRNLITIKGHVTTFELDGASLHLSNSDECARLEHGNKLRLVTPHLMVQSRSDDHPGGRTLKIDWLDGSSFEGHMPAGSSTRCTGKLALQEQKSPPQDLTGLLEVGRRLTLSKWGDLDFKQNRLFAEGQFQTQILFKSMNFTTALQTMTEGEFHDQSPDDEIRICHEFRNLRPDSCKVTVNREQVPSSLAALYLQEQEDVAGLSCFQNPWGVIPKIDRVQTWHMQTTAPIGRVILTSLMPWNPEEKTLDGWGEIVGVGDLGFEWKGLFSGGEPSNRGSLYLEGSRLPVITFDSEENTTNIPLSLLPVMAELLGKHLIGTYPFSAKVWGEQGTWPPAGFEGFINRFERDQYTFTGYITSTGRAIGILGNLRPEQNIYYSAHAGNFLVHSIGIVKDAPLSIDGQSRQLLNLPVGQLAVLAAHGLVQEYMITKTDNSPIGRIDRVYFCGQGVSIHRITQNPDLVYQAPNHMAYLVGTGYTDKQKSLLMDFMFNPGDGGEDFVKIKPAGFEKEENFRELYVDASGTRANWVVINKSHKMGQVRFPCGLEYSGQVACSNDFFNLQGQGKITFGSLSFSARFNPEGTVTDLQPKTEDSKHWLSSYSGRSVNRSFQLGELIELISGGQLSYQSDIRPHLLNRKLDGAKHLATVFSKE